MQIMIAEDAALMRHGLEAILTRAGHHVTATVGTATELQTALTRPEAPLPDLLITDVRMPPTNTDDGLRAAISVRQHHPQLPVLLLSQYLGTRYLERLLDATDSQPHTGGSGYLLKDRVAHVTDFLTALDTISAGGIVIDQKVLAAARRPSHSPLSSLTPRETEVLRLVATGATNPDIAATLHLSEGAIVKHLSTVFDKLGLNQQAGNRRVLAALAYIKAASATEM